MNRNRQPKTQNPKQPKERNGVSSPPSPSPSPPLPPRTLTRTRAHTPHPTIPPPIATATTITAAATPTLPPTLLPGAAPLLRTVDPLGTVFPPPLGFGVKRTTLGLVEEAEAEEEGWDTVRVDEGFREESVTPTCVRAPRQHPRRERGEGKGRERGTYGRRTGTHRPRPGDGDTGTGDGHVRRDDRDGLGRRSRLGARAVDRRRSDRRDPRLGRRARLGVGVGVGLGGGRACVLCGPWARRGRRRVHRVRRLGGCRAGSGGGLWRARGGGGDGDGDADGRRGRHRRVCACFGGFGRGLRARDAVLRDQRECHTRGSVCVERSKWELTSGTTVRTAIAWTVESLNGYSVRCAHHTHTYRRVAYSP